MPRSCGPRGKDSDGGELRLAPHELRWARRGISAGEVEGARWATYPT